MKSKRRLAAFALGMLLGIPYGSVVGSTYAGIALGLGLGTAMAINAGSGKRAELSDPQKRFAKNILLMSIMLVLVTLMVSIYALFLL